MAFWPCHRHGCARSSTSLRFMEIATSQSRAPRAYRDNKIAAGRIQAPADRGHFVGTIGHRPGQQVGKPRRAGADAGTARSRGLQRFTLRTELSVVSRVGLQLPAVLGATTVLHSIAADDYST